MTKLLDLDRLRNGLPARPADLLVLATIFEAQDATAIPRDVLIAQRDELLEIVRWAAGNMALYDENLSRLQADATRSVMLVRVMRPDEFETVRDIFAEAEQRLAAGSEAP